MRIRWKEFELPTKVLLDEASASRTYGRFVVEPFERGFATTLGNSLRRVLYSSIEGAAVTHVKIKGASHEFQTLPGVAEDVTDVVLNLKQLVVRLAEKGPVTLVLDAEKKGAVKAAHIAPVPGVEIVNPELQIATLAEDAPFHAELTVRLGRRYVTAEEHGRDGEVGLIPIDSTFSPVTRVAYRVENTRVGKQTDYERLVLEVWTNGSVTPDEALVEAAKILRKHINPFVMYFELGRELQVNEQREEELRKREKYLEELKQKLSMSISELDLSVRSANCLNSEHIETIGELVQRSEADLLKVRNFGKTSLREVKKKLSDLSLSLGMNLDDVFRTKRAPFGA
jgi:DNA-directed RNA polymerase subunit alpha